MHGIYIMAILTTIASLVIWGSLVRSLSRKENQNLIWLAFASTLIMQPLVFYAVRVPLNTWLVGLMGKESGWYTFLTTLYAPLTEEPAKFWPALLIPFLFRAINEKNVVPYGLALGLGFGIGEIWFIAYQITLNPAWSDIPFYNFMGFAGERLIVCFMHGAFTAVALKFLHRGFGFGLGVISAMTLHYFLNFPILLAAINYLDLGKDTWTIFLSIWVQLYFFGSIGLMAMLHLGAFSKMGEFLFGKAKCPECGEIYPRPILGLNLGARRYERCPHCHKFHLLESKEYVEEESPKEETV